MALWAIFNTDGSLAEQVEMPAGVTPGDEGSGYDTTGQTVHRITRKHDLAVEQWTGSGWAPRLDVLRAARWAEAKAVREAKATGGCETPLGRVDTDPESQRKINGAVTGALVAQAAGQPFAVAWTMADNSVVDHDAAAMIAMGMAVLAHIDACQVAGTAIRGAIDAAADADAIAAINIEEGYP